jgi:hypothetical protein
MLKRWLRKWLEVPLPASHFITLDTGIMLDTLKRTTVLTIEKYCAPKLDDLIQLGLEQRLHDAVHEELHKLMKESESVFIYRVADELAKKVSELAEKSTPKDRTSTRESD